MEKNKNNVLLLLQKSHLWVSVWCCFLKAGKSVTIKTTEPSLFVCLFLKEIITFIQQGCTKLIKSYIYNGTKYILSSSFELSIHKLIIMHVS